MKTEYFESVSKNTCFKFDRVCVSAMWRVHRHVCRNMFCSMLRNKVELYYFTESHFVPL